MTRIFSVVAPVAEARSLTTYDDMWSRYRKWKPALALPLAWVASECLGETDGSLTWFVGLSIGSLFSYRVSG